MALDGKKRIFMSSEADRATEREVKRGGRVGEEAEEARAVLAERGRLRGGESP